jgi:hypothetical protein
VTDEGLAAARATFDRVAVSVTAQGRIESRERVREIMGRVMTIGLVLDPSAILAHTQREKGVAHLLALADRVLLPALALVETRAELAYKEELHLLDLLVSRLPTVETVGDLDGIIEL